MSKSYKTSLFIFRRDLRITDNTGLYEALQQSHVVIPCFIIDPIQTSNQNRYRSIHAIQFMTQSLHELANDLAHKDGELFLFKGIPHEVVDNLIKHHEIQAVFFNRDYTPYSRHRDKHIQKVCNQHKIPLHIYADGLLHEPEDVLKKDGTPYQIFTPFYRCAGTIPVREPQTHRTYHFFNGNIKESVNTRTLDSLIDKPTEKLFAQGGSKQAHKILSHLTQFANYTKERDFPGLAKTTGLSAHLKFGTLSVRQVFYALQKSLGPSHPLIRQLYWRDFLTHIAYHFPHVFGHAFNPNFEHVEWDNDPTLFKHWQTGTTGFPIVDAGMRQLAQTGFMHNRVRMIVASFLVKDLLIDWRWGERHFAQFLIDYDPSVNNGNWQWAASTGCDAQPYFRIFNPWLQQKKFDPQCVYIKHWIPELQEVPIKTIHTWYTSYQTTRTNYPTPCVEHSPQAAEAKRRFSNAKRKEG